MNCIQIIIPRVGRAGNYEFVVALPNPAIGDVLGSIAQNRSVARIDFSKDGSIFRKRIELPCIGKQIDSGDGVVEIDLDGG